MFDPHMPFTVARALTEGLTHRELATEFTRVLEGVYISTRVPVTTRIKAQAALVVHPPGAVLSHDSTARMLRAPVKLDPHEHVTVADDRDRRQRRGVRPHAMTLRTQDVGLLDGLPATTPERTFVDLAGRLPLVELVVLGDWLVRAGHTTVERLVDFCRACPARYARRAAEAAAYVRAGVDSPQETRTRMLVVLAGLPEPAVGVVYRDEDGSVLMQIDMEYRLQRASVPVRRGHLITGIAVEYDGRDHLESARQWDKDASRLDGYALLQLQPLRVTASGLHRDAHQTVHRVYSALRSLGWPGLEPPTEAWRPHFGQ